MNNLWLKMRIWAKVLLFAVVVIYVVLFAWENGEREAKMWIWFGSRSDVPTSVLKLVLITFASGILVSILTRTTVRTIRQIRDLKDRQRTGRMEKELSEMKAKAGMLRPKESPTNTGSSQTPAA